MAVRFRKQICQTMNNQINKREYKAPKISVVELRNEAQLLTVSREQYQEILW